jgi:hypothetical protein
LDPDLLQGLADEEDAEERREREGGGEAYGRARRLISVSEAADVQVMAKEKRDRGTKRTCDFDDADHEEKLRPRRRPKRTISDSSSPVTSPFSGKEHRAVQNEVFDVDKVLETRSRSNKAEGKKIERVSSTSSSVLPATGGPDDPIEILDSDDESSPQQLQIATVTTRPPTCLAEAVAGRGMDRFVVRSPTPRPIQQALVRINPSSEPQRNQSTLLSRVAPSDCDASKIKLHPSFRFSHSHTAFDISTCDPLCLSKIPILMPSLLSHKLFPHQEEAVKFMWKNTMAGITEKILGTITLSLFC